MSFVPPARHLLRGKDLVEEPEERPYGIDSGLRDPRATICG
jgi:hypothetical protein